MESHVIEVLLLSGLAGLATGLGGLLVLLRRPSRRFCAFCMGFAAGIMLLLSFLELMIESIEISGILVAAAGFVGGSLTMFTLDSLLPHTRFAVIEKGVIDGRLFRAGILIAIGISLHNFPEGLAVAMGYEHMPKLGLLLAIAIGIHNIPEGMATALPIYVAGASRLTALMWAVGSGLAEPLGALISVLFLEHFPDLVPIGLAFAAGVMVFITIDELIPTGKSFVRRPHRRRHRGGQDRKEYQQILGHEHYTSLGLIAGSIVTFGLLAVLQMV